VFTAEEWEHVNRIVIERAEWGSEDLRWIAEAGYGRWAGIMSLIISLTPNLEEVEFFNLDDTLWDCPPLLGVFQRAQILQDARKESPFSLSKLRKASVHFIETTNFFNIAIPMLRLKSVESLHSYKPRSKNFEVSTDYQMTLTTKDLRFERGVIKHDNLIAFLEYFRQLERFHYEFDIWDEMSELARVARALERFKTCLSDLTLIAVERHFENPEVDVPRIGLFGGFEKLVSIKASAILLIGTCLSKPRNPAEPRNLVDAVPPTLQSLSLMECTH
jgi:hypothetical protein